MAPHAGQPTKLTPALQQAIINAVAAGASPACAGQLAGLSPATVSAWMQRGSGTHRDLKPTPKYIAFFEAITRAQAQDQIRRIARIEQAGRGGAVTSSKTTRFPDGRVVTEETTAQPDWRADAFHLERRYAKVWAKQDQIDVRLTIQETAQKVAEEFGIPVEAILARAQAFLQEPARVTNTG